MKPAVLLLGSFDTKGEEYALVRSLIQARGFPVLTLDLGVLGGAEAAPFPIEVDAEALLPIDETQHGFDNIGAALSVSSAVI